LISFLFIDLFKNRHEIKYFNYLKQIGRHGPSHKEEIRKWHCKLTKMIIIKCLWKTQTQINFHHFITRQTCPNNKAPSESKKRIIKN